MKKKRKKHDNIVLLTKTKINTIKVYTSKALVNSNIYRDEFGSKNSVLREYNNSKEEIKIPKNAVKYTI